MRTSCLLALPLAALATACASTRPAPETWAYLGGTSHVHVVTGDHEVMAPGTSGAETFAWGRDGALWTTSGGALARVDETGAATIALDGWRELRFPDVRRRDGAVVVAALPAAPRDEWTVVLLAADAGARPAELGPGYDPCFTPDGDAVLFERTDDAGTSIWIQDLATGERRRLADGHTPAATADGSGVVFSSEGHLWQLELADPNTVRQLTSAGDYDRFASASPDGTRLLFFRQHDGVESIVELDLGTGVERPRREGRVGPPAYRP